MVWRYGGEGATHRVGLGSMQRFMVGRLRHDSSSTDKVKQS